MSVQRSKPYPSMNLSEGVKKIEELVRKLGTSKKYDKNSFAQGLGYKNATNGAFLRTSAALIQYNLVQREGESYSLSQISSSILWPTNNNAKAKAIMDAALSPQVFEAIYEAYQGQELPALLPNILVAEHGILVGAKDKVVSIFKSTMEFAGLINGNTLTKNRDGASEEVSEAIDTTNIDNAQTAPAQNTPSHLPVPASLVATTSLIKDFGEGRIASLTIPTDLNEDERKKLANLIENM